MDGVSRKQAVQCPLCDGHGRFEGEDLVSRLRDPHFLENVAAWRQAILEDHAKPEPELACAARPSFDSEVHSWPNTHFLWRRSPKE
jgi:hypothetical protein